MPLGKLLNRKDLLGLCPTDNVGDEDPISQAIEQTLSWAAPLTELATTVIEAVPEAEPYAAVANVANDSLESLEGANNAVKLGTSNDISELNEAAFTLDLMLAAPELAPEIAGAKVTSKAALALAQGIKTFSDGASQLILQGAVEEMTEGVDSIAYQ